MQIIETSDVYSYVCTDAEWYGITAAARNAIVDQCKGAAADRGKRHASVFVQPSAILSISPNPRRHRVWHYTAPLPIEEELRRDLADLRRDALKAGMTLGQIAIIANEVFG